MMKKNVKCTLMIAVFLSALYCPAKADFINSNQTYDTYGYQNTGTLNVGGTIENNSANNISNPSAYSFGGAIYNTGSLNVLEDAIFQHNFVNGSNDDRYVNSYGSAGGAISALGNSTITIGNNVQFIQNGYKNSSVLSNAITDSTSLDSAAGALAGGAIYNSGSNGMGGITIGNNVTFDKNIAFGRGGAIYNGAGVISIGDGATFKNNASNTGGAIYNYHSGETADISIGNNATFQNNSAFDKNGGAIANFYGNLNVGENANFEGNKAGQNGGAIINSSDKALGGAFVANASIGKNSSFTNNSANVGGAIYNDTDSIMNIKGGTKFQNNTAKTNGGAIYTEGQLNLDTTDGNIVFSGNTAAKGSDVYLADGSKMNISGNNDIKFSSSGQAIAGSGAIVKDGSGVLNLETGDFATGYTGQYTQNSGKLAVKNATMFKNVNVVGGSIELKDGAKVDGATIALNGNNVDITAGAGSIVELSNGTTFTSETGSTITKSNEGTLVLKDVDYSGFKGDYVQTGGNVELNNAQMFVNNKVSGGGLDMKNGSTLNLTGDTVLTEDATVSNSKLNIAGDATFQSLVVNKTTKNRATRDVVTDDVNVTGNFDAADLTVDGAQMSVGGTSTIAGLTNVQNGARFSSADKITVNNNLNLDNGTLIGENGLEVTGQGKFANNSNTTVKGNTTLGSLDSNSSNLTLDGSKAGNLVVNGTTNTNGGTINVQNGTSTFTGASTIAGTTVTSSGKTSFGSSLNANSNATINANGGLEVADNANISGNSNVNVTGTAAFNKTLILNSGTVTSDTLNVTEQATIQNGGKTITSGTATFGGGVDMSGSNSQIKGGSIVINGTNANGNGITSTGGAIQATVGNLIVQNNANLTNTTVNVAGAGNFNSGLTASFGTRPSTANMTFGNGLTVGTNNTDNLSLTNANLNVTGALNAAGASNITNTIANITGTSIFNNGLSISGTSNITSGDKLSINAGGLNMTGGNLTVSSNGMSVTGNSTVNGNSKVTVTGSTVFDNGLTLGGTNTEVKSSDGITINGTNTDGNGLTSTGGKLTTTGGNITVANNANLTNTTVTSAGGASFGGTLTTNGGSVLANGGNLSVTGNADFKNNTTVKSSGDTTFGANLTANGGSITSGGNFSATGASDLTSTRVNVTGNANFNGGLTTNGTSSNKTTITTGAGKDISASNMNLNQTTMNSGGNITVTDTTGTTAASNSSISSAGNITINNNLTSNNSSITTTNNGNLDVKGNTTLTDTTVNVEGSANFENGLTSNNTSEKEIHVGNGLTVGNGSTGDLNLNNNNLTVDNGGIDVKGNTVLTDTVANVTGNGSFGNGLTLQGGSDLSVSGSVNVAAGGMNVDDSKLTVGNGLTVTGDSLISNGSEVNVTGDASFTGNLKVDGSEFNTLAGGNITVTGETVLKDATTDFSGEIDFQGGLKTEGSSNLTFNTDLVADDLDFAAGTKVTVNGGKADVSGNSTLNNTNVTISNKAGDTENSFDGNMDLSNKSNLVVTGDNKGNVTIGGKTTISDSKIDVNGNLSLEGGIDGSDSTSKTVNAGGDLTVGKIDTGNPLNSVISDAILNNAKVDVGGDMTVTGSTTLTDTIATVAGNGNYVGGLNLSGSTVGKSGLTIGGDLNSKDLAMNNSTLNVGNDSNILGEVNLTNSIMNVGSPTSGDASYGDNVSLNGSTINVKGNAEFTKADGTVTLTNNSNLNIDKNADFKGDLSASNSNVDVKGNMTVDGTTTVNTGNLTVGENLTTTGTTDLSTGNLTVGGNWDATGSASLTDVIANITGSASFENGLNVNSAQNAGGARDNFTVGTGLTVGSGVTVADMNLTNTNLTVNGGGVNVSGSSVLSNTVASVTGTTTIQGDLTLAEGSQISGTDTITVNGANGLTVNKGDVQTTGGDLIVLNKTDLTDAQVDVKGNASFGDGLTINKGTKQTIVQTGGNLNSTTITSDNGSITVGGALSATGQSILNDTSVTVTGDANFTGGLEANKGAEVSNTKYLIQSNGAINTGIMDVTNVKLVAGNGLHATDNSSLTASIIEVAGGASFDGTLTASGSSITVKEVEGITGKDLTIVGLATLDKTSVNVAGDANFNGGLTANQGAEASTSRYEIKANGAINTSTMDVTNVVLKAGNGLHATGASNIISSSLDVTGNADFDDTLTTSKGSVIITKAIEGVANGDLTVAGLAALNETSANIAGNANFNGGLTANQGAAASTSRYEIKTGGDINTTTMDVTNVVLNTHNLNATGDSILSSSIANVIGNADFGGALNTTGSAIIVKENTITRADDGNLTVTDKATLVDTPVSVAGNATFNGGLETSSTDNQRRAFTVGKDFTSTTTSLGDTNLTVAGNLTSTGAAQLNNSNLSVANNAVFGDGLSVIGKSIDDKSNINIKGTSDITGDLNLTKSVYTVLGSSTVSGITNADDHSEIHVIGDGIFDGKLTVQNNSSIEIGNNIAFNDGFDLLNNSNAYIHGDPTLDGDIRVTNGSVLNFVNPTHGFNTATGGSLFMQNGTVNEMNNVITSNNFNGNFTIGDNSTANFTVDIDPRNFKADSFTFNSIQTETPGAQGTVMISDFNFSSFPLDRHVKLPQMFYSSTEIPDNINFLANDKLVFSPIGWYGLFGSQGQGYTASLVKYNPQVFRGQVATRAQFANQWVIDDILLNHGMLQGNRYLNEEDANKYSAILPQFAPYQYNKRQGGLWFKSYGNFETLSMTQDLNVKNNAYGALVGADFPVVDMENGWSFMPTAYVSYNGSHQTFDYVGMYQNGGQAGAMGTFMKGNFIGSVLANGGVYGNSMDVANTTDETFNWFAGTAAKAAYNLDITEHFTVQPTLMAMYNTFGEQNWYSSFGDMGMYSGFLYGLNVAPGLNLIYGKKDWSVYATLQYVFNPLDNMQGHVGRTVDLPRIGLRHTFFEYGIGFTKMWQDRLNSYGQITFRNGGRTGVSFQFGLNWLF